MLWRSIIFIGHSVSQNKLSSSVIQVLWSKPCIVYTTDTTFQSFVAGDKHIGAIATNTIKAIVHDRRMSIFENTPILSTLKDFDHTDKTNNTSKTNNCAPLAVATAVAAVTDNLINVQVTCELMELHLNSYLLFRV